MKDLIIRILGGVTLNDDIENQKSSYNTGFYVATLYIQNRMKELNGKPLDQWAHEAYSYVEKLQKDILKEEK